jgi:ABC-type glycerol-3-phosphate transport system permease component
VAGLRRAIAASAGSAAESVLARAQGKRTLPVGLNFFQGQFANDIPLLMAGATITFMPIVIIYLIFQRHFIQGIAAGALKS